MVGIYKGHNSIKTVDGVIVLNLYTLSDDALYLYHVSRKYLTGFQSYWADAICVLKFAKRHISIKHVDGDMVLILSTMIDEVLYLYQVLSKYLIEF